MQRYRRAISPLDELALNMNINHDAAVTTCAHKLFILSIRAKAIVQRQNIVPLAEVPYEQTLWLPSQYRTVFNKDLSQTPTAPK